MTLYAVTFRATVFTEAENWRDARSDSWELLANKIDRVQDLTQVFKVEGVDEAKDIIPL